MSEAKGMVINMKVLHLLSSDKFSGAENLVCQIIGMFKNDDFEMLYCSPNGDIRTALEQQNVSFYPLEKLSVSEVRRAINKYKPDIIHAHDAKASVVAALTGTNARIISHIHGNHENMRTFSLKSLMLLLTSNKYQHIYWVSKTALDCYIFNKKMIRKSSVLYNVVNQDSLIKKMQEDNVNYDYDVVFIGRLSYPKNPERLMRVLRGTVDKVPTMKAAIVGTGDLIEQTKKMCMELGLERNVSFLGFLNNPLKVLHDSKVMIMTSRYEGTPMCALEAMALGIPIVSTPTDGLLELVKEYKTGYLSDSDAELAEKLALIISNDVLRINMSEYTHRTFNEFNNIRKYKQILKKEYLNG